MIPWFNIQIPPLGPIQIHMFGILVATGILVGARLTRRRGRELGLTDEAVGSMITTSLICGFLIAHIFDVFAYQTSGPRPTFWQIINPFGGLSSYGGFVGALIGLFAWCRYRGERVMPYADSLAYGLAIGWMFGRLGCFTAHDHPGRLTHFWLALDYGTHYPGGVRHDLGLDEALWAAAMTILFAVLSRKKRPLGLYLALLTIGYAPARFALDFLRATDLSESDPRYLGLTPAQWGSILVLLAGLGVLGWMRKQRGMVAVKRAT